MVQTSHVPVVLLQLVLIANAAAAQVVQDQRALQVEALMVEAMGGRKGWEQARFFDFIWAVERGGRTVERHHVWDRWTGRYKLEAPVGDHRMVAVFNTNTKEGDVWLDGHKLGADSARTLLDRAYAIYINDAYWFLMPFKWRDPGVNLRYQGITRDSLGRWETVELTFEDVGLTPENRYLAFIDPETHLMRWWEHYRTRSDTAANVRSAWNDWQRRGPILVSLDRPFAGGGARIYFPRAIIRTEVPEGAFERQ